MRIFAALLMAATIAGAQVEDGTISVAAVQTLTIQQPDEFTLDLYVTAKLDAGLEGVLDALAGIALQADELQYAYGYDEKTAQFIFSVRRPLTKINDVLRFLAPLARNPDAPVSVDFRLQGSVSQAAVERQVCALTTLISRARAQAEAAAAVAGLRVGEVLQVSDGQAAQGVPTGVVMPALFQGTTQGSDPFPVPRTVVGSVSCAAVVQFQLLH